MWRIFSHDPCGQVPKYRTRYSLNSSLAIKLIKQTNPLQEPINKHLLSNWWQPLSAVDVGFSSEPHIEHGATLERSLISSYSVLSWHLNRMWVFFGWALKVQFNKLFLGDEGIPSPRNTSERHERFDGKPWQNFHYEVPRKLGHCHLSWLTQCCSLKTPSEPAEQY